ncbi:hypothetical protein ACFX2I_027631 [Malus domestica]
MMYCSTTACTMKLSLRVKLVQRGTRTSLMRQQKPWSRSVLCLEELIEVRILNNLYEAKVLPPLRNRNLEISRSLCPAELWSGCGDVAAVTMATICSLLWRKSKRYMLQGRSLGRRTPKVEDRIDGDKIELADAAGESVAASVRRMVALEKLVDINGRDERDGVVGVED